MDENILSQINKFMEVIKNNYPALYIDYEYDEENDEYLIWHNDMHLQFENNEFIKYVGNKAQDLLYGKDIYNFSFSYDYAKAQKIVEGKYSQFYNITLPNTEYSIEKKSGFTTNEKIYKRSTSPFMIKGKVKKSREITIRIKSSGVIKDKYTKDINSDNKKYTLNNPTLMVDIEEMRLVS